MSEIYAFILLFWGESPVRTILGRREARRNPILLIQRKLMTSMKNSGYKIKDARFLLCLDSLFCQLFLKLSDTDFYLLYYYNSTVIAKGLIWN